jgi:hypothetical protein
MTEEDDITFDLIKEMNEVHSSSTYSIFVTKLAELYETQPQTVTSLFTYDFVQQMANKLEDYAFRDLIRSQLVSAFVDLLRCIPSNQFIYESSIPFVIISSLRFYTEDGELWKKVCQFLFDNATVLREHVTIDLPKYITTLVSATIRFPSIAPQVVQFFDLVHTPTDQTLILHSLLHLLVPLHEDEKSIPTLFSILLKSIQDAPTCLLVIQKLVSITHHHHHTQTNPLVDVMILEWLSRSTLEIKEVIDIIAKDKLHRVFVALLQRSDVCDSIPHAIRVLTILELLLKDHRTKKTVKRQREPIMLSMGLILNLDSEEIQTKVSNLCQILQKKKK